MRGRAYFFLLLTFLKIYLQHGYVNFQNRKVKYLDYLVNKF